MATSAYVLKMAAKLSDNYLRGYREYLEACEEDRRNGFRPHYCEHGTSNWTDYDNICGPCEDGLTMRDGVTRRRHALDNAKARYERAMEITRAASLLRDLVPDLDIAPVWKEVERMISV